jgi:integrase
MIEAVGHYLGFLSTTSISPKADTLPALVREDKVLAWIAAMQARHLTAYTVRFRVTGLLHGCQVMYPFENWTWLKRVVGDLPDGRLQSRRRKLPQLRDSRELLRLGLDLIAGAEERHFLRPHLRQVQRRDGLMITFLALWPLRIKNFSCLQIGRHLVRREDGRWRLRIPSDEMKNYETVDGLLPDELGQMLDHYLAQDRPVLLGRRMGDPSSEDHLWISEDGVPCTPTGIRLRINEHTLKAFGVSISPHRFRDAGVTTIAMELPEHIDMGLALLGNRSRETMLAHYNMADTNQAGLLLIEAVEGLTNELELTGVKPGRER